MYCVYVVSLHIDSTESMIQLSTPPKNVDVQLLSVLKLVRGMPQAIRCFSRVVIVKAYM